MAHALSLQHTERLLTLPVCRAITFLQDFAVEHPAAVDATHVNMLSQLLIEKGRFGDALVALERAPLAEGDVPFPDIATKQGICFLNLSRPEQGLQALQQLQQESAPAYHDLFVSVRCPTISEHISAQFSADWCDHFVSHCQLDRNFKCSASEDAGVRDVIERRVWSA